MGQPRLLLLDEPSLGLSPALADEILSRVRSIVKSGTAVFLAEQNLARALQCCDWACMLEIGKMTFNGEAAGLRNTEAIRKAYLGG